MIKKIVIPLLFITGVLNASIFSYNKNSNYNILLESQRVNRAYQVAKEIKSLYNLSTLYILETGDTNINLNKIIEYYNLNKNNYKNYFKDGYIKIHYQPNNGIQFFNIISNNQPDINDINIVYTFNAIKKDTENLLEGIQNIAFNLNNNEEILIPESKQLKTFNILKKIYSSYPECQKARFSIEIVPNFHSTICKINKDGTVSLYEYSFNKKKHIFIKKLFINQNFSASKFLVSTFSNIALNETADGKKIINLVPGTIVFVYDDKKPKNERVLIPLLYTGKNWIVIDFKTALISKTNLLINTTNKFNNVQAVDNLIKE